MRLSAPIFDDRRCLLLAAGQVITAGFLERLRNWGIRTVQVEASEISRFVAAAPRGTGRRALPARTGVECPHSNAVSDRLDSAIDREQYTLHAREDVFATHVRWAGPVPYDGSLHDHLTEWHFHTRRQLAAAVTRFSHGQGVELRLLTSIADDALSDILQDPDLFAAIGIDPCSDSYPAPHSLHVATLALCIGTHLSLDRPALRELAIGCLIHDAGMLRLRSNQYTEPKVLHPLEFLEITKHPILLFDAVQDFESVPANSALVAYQIHERCNGSGYPRRWKSNRIHLLAQIAAVADTYIAMVSPRPHRPGLIPHYAIREMLFGVRDGLFASSAVRALLRTTSLFPLGSCVRLCDGRTARVIRSNGDRYDSPIVEAWEPGHPDSAPEVVDLTRSASRIIALHSPNEEPEPPHLPICGESLECDADIALG